jgi:hypothetical protein
MSPAIRDYPQLLSLPLIVLSSSLSQFAGPSLAPSFVPYPDNAH